MVSDLICRWIERDLRYAKIGGNIQVTKNCTIDGKEYFSFKIYTDVNCYKIDAILNIDENKPKHDYLGCISQSRKPRAGEDWNRGNDLPDGDLSEETWHSILGAILGYELVAVHF